MIKVSLLGLELMFDLLVVPYEGFTTGYKPHRSVSLVEFKH